MRHGVGLWLFWVKVFLCAYTAVNGQTPARYFLTPTVEEDPQVVVSFLIAQPDSLQADTLYQINSRAGTPIAYYTTVIQEVCYDEKCRLLHVNVYWNITGRYLGIELPAGEFLSKAEHEPFSRHEYDQLNVILADSLSPLANLLHSELAPGDRAVLAGVDGITSATSAEVSRYVVPGAAYTTYTLWHYVYGKVREQVISRTEKVLSPELILNILNSRDRSDVYWMLDRLKDKPISPDVADKLLSLIRGDDYNLSLKTIQSISPVHLAVDTMQFGLFDAFMNAEYSLKNLILSNFLDAPVLHDTVALRFAEQLNTLNGEPLTRVFMLFERHRVTDLSVLKYISALLTRQNTFVSDKAYQYLLAINPDDRDIRRALRRYRR